MSVTIESAIVPLIVNVLCTLNRCLISPLFVPNSPLYIYIYICIYIYLCDIWIDFVKRVYELFISFFSLYFNFIFIWILHETQLWHEVTFLHMSQQLNRCGMYKCMPCLDDSNRNGSKAKFPKLSITNSWTVWEIERSLAMYDLLWTENDWLENTTIRSYIVIELKAWLNDYIPWFYVDIFSYYNLIAKLCRPNDCDCDPLTGPQFHLLKKSPYNPVKHLLVTFVGRWKWKIERELWHTKSQFSKKSK